MQLELKPFQELFARELIDELSDARDAVARNKLQAVVLSAPTGSGKTITVAAVIDQLLGGGDGIPARPNTVFLWLSDSPELNAQSKGKLLRACDYLKFFKMVTISSEEFDQRKLDLGFLYFINTQLLGKAKRLTSHSSGDRRRFTFWQTIANTVAEHPQDFILIIDEAHRGASGSDRTRTPIMQKFIKGSEADGLPPVPLVLAMSATPQRFNDLLGNTTRTQRPVIITPEDVRPSGLLKDLIVIHHPKANSPGDLTLLEQAAIRWKHFTQLWADYCQQEKEKETVRPIFVVQVEDGTENTLTRTNLSEALRVIERQTGALGPNELVHCFDVPGELSVGDRSIRKIEPSRIQDSSETKVVLFKTALTTGWDCPRAEVMMSFRRSQDPTSIAQLIGRMIRTPLARSIGTEAVLDTVELFLPHYDDTALKNVLTQLRNPEAEDGLPTQTETDVSEYQRSPGLDDVFAHLASLPTYSVTRIPKMSDVKRALRLAGMLVHDGLNKNADENLREVLTTKLRALRDDFATNDPEWQSSVRQGGEIDVDVTLVAVDHMKVTGKKGIRVILSEENINQLFEASGRLLAAGEGLHRSYWKRFHDHNDPNAAKLELYTVLKQPTALAEMASLAQLQFDALWNTYKAKIQRLPAADKSRFQTLIQASGKPVQLDWELPNDLVVKKVGDSWKSHLYADDQGDFYADLNGWEKEILRTELGRGDLVGWLRNLPRKNSLCIPYELAGTKPFYPDFVFIYRVASGYQVDVIEPHDDTRSDTWAKAKGMAEFADSHGMEFGRLIIARKKNGVFQMADMNEKATREKARKMQSQSDLESIFA